MADARVTQSPREPSFQAWWENEFVPYKQRNFWSNEEDEYKHEDTDQITQKLHLAESMCRKGNKDKAIDICRKSLWQLVECTPALDRFNYNTPPAVRLMGDIMRQILRIYAHEVDPAPFREVWRKQSAQNSNIYASRNAYAYLMEKPSVSDCFLEQWFCMQMESQSDETELLHTYHILLCAIVGFYPDAWARRFASDVLGYLERYFGADSEEVKSLLAFLANNYIFGNGNSALLCKEPTISGRGAAVVQRHLSFVKGSPLDLHSLRYLFGLGAVHLARWEENEAVALFQLSFDGRIQVLGETHTTSSEFISPLLESFCRKRAGEMVMRYKPDAHSLIHYLIKYCLEEELSNKVEILVEECLWHDGIFEHFNQRHSPLNIPKDSIQHTLATHLSPGYCVYWRDSRLYTHQWPTLRLIPTYPKEIFPCSPVKLHVTPQTFDVEMTPNALADWKETLCVQSEQEVFDRVQTCETLVHLARLHDRGKLLPERCEQWTRYSAPSLTSDPWPSEKPEHKNIKNATLWVFLDEDFDETPLKKTATALVVPHNDPLPKFEIGLAGSFLSSSDYLVCGPPGISVQKAIVWNEGYSFNYFADEDERKAGRWGSHLSYGSLSKDPGGCETLHEKVDPLLCEIFEIGGRSIDLTTSYIPYEHFCESRAFREGLTYLEYMDVMKKVIIGIGYGHGPRDPFKEIRPRMCLTPPNPSKLASYDIICESSHSDQQEDSSYGITQSGNFFNGIPCGLAFLSTQEDLEGYHLVSSRWRDWCNFTVYRPSESDAPRLVLENGETANCQGYIMGSLYKDDLSQKWTGVRVFIVDAIFVDKETGRCANFLFDARSFAFPRICEVPTFEKRTITAELCPGLFTQGYIPPPRYGAAFWKQSHKTPTQDTSLEEEYMDEMNRREQWDRRFEKRIRPLKRFADLDEEDKGVLRALEVEKKEEEERRLGWDQERKGRVDLGKGVDARVEEVEVHEKPAKGRFGFKRR